MGPNIAIHYAVNFNPRKYDKDYSKTLTLYLLQDNFQVLTDFLKHGSAQK